MALNNNTWEIAEAHINGTLSEADKKELNQKLEADTVFANEFYECVHLVTAMRDNGSQKQFRSMLRDIHQEQVTKKENKKARLIWLNPQLWRTAAVAAGVAILTSTITIMSLNPTIRKHDTQYNTINREVSSIKRAQAEQAAQQKEQGKQLNEIISKNTRPAPPPSDVRYTGTGFALTNDGYFVTADHVVHGNGEKGEFDSVYIQTHEGQYYKAALIYYNRVTDIAVLKVEKKNFHFGKTDVPYTFAAEKAGLGERIFTLGFPKEDIIYGEGYISSRNGFEGDIMQYTLELPAGHGQSGSPVIDGNGNVLGILTAVGSAEESNTYAISTKALVEMLHKMPDNTLKLAKHNKLNKLSRAAQIEKMEPYTFSVKVYKK